jgi:hypothetical protein
MQRTLALIWAIVMVCMTGAATWVVGLPALAPLLVRDATAIQVVSVSVWERQLTYWAPGPPYAWYFTVTRNLENSGWRALNRWRPEESSTYDPIVPLRFERQYPGVVWDQLVLVPDRRDPQRATITMRRRISIRWWRYWLLGGEEPNQKNLVHTCCFWQGAPEVS